MSSTTTTSKAQKKVPNVTIAMLRQALGQALSGMVAAEAGVVTATEKLGHARVKVGASLLALAVKWSEGATPVAAKDIRKPVQEKLVAEIKTATSKEYDWSTVEAWITAAMVESTLPENLRGVFGSDSLRTIKRIGGDNPSTEKLADRATFAESLKETPTVAAVRKAYKDRTGDNGGSTKEKDPAKEAGKIRDSLDAKVLKSAREVLKRNNISHTTIKSPLMVAFQLGQAGSKADAATMSFVLDIVFGDKS